MSILPRNSKDFRRIIGNFEDMKRITILLVTFIVASCSNAPQLERRYEELPLGAIKPAGWLKETLIRQRDWGLAAMVYSPCMVSAVCGASAVTFEEYGAERFSTREARRLLLGSIPD